MKTASMWVLSSQTKQLRNNKDNKLVIIKLK